MHLTQHRSPSAPVLVGADVRQKTMTTSNTEAAISKPVSTPPAVKPTVLDPNTEDIDPSPFLNYLQSPQGHEIASRVVGFIEDLKKTALDKNYSHAKFNRWMEAGIIVIVVAAVVWLSIVDKLNPTVGVLLGSVVGYFFGKNK